MEEFKNLRNYNHFKEQINKNTTTVYAFRQINSNALNMIKISPVSNIDRVVVYRSKAMGNLTSMIPIIY